MPDTDETFEETHADETRADDATLDEAYAVSAEGAELYAEVVGPRDAPVIFYLHGGPGYNSHSFRDLVGDELSRYLVIYADQRGGGRSPADGGVNLALLAEDVVTLLGALSISQTTLLAHGFGALVAAEVAARAPERVSKLLLVNPWVDMALLARTLQRSAAFMSGNTDLALPPEGALTENEGADPEALLEQAFSWTASKTLFDALEFPKPSSRLRLEHSDADALFGLPAGELPTDVWSLEVRDLLPTLSLPTVVLAGREDQTSVPDQVEVVLERMPHALTSLLDAGHYPWLDDPDTFLALLHETMAL